MILWAGQTRGPRWWSRATYQVRLTAKGKTLTQPLEMRKDPRLATAGPTSPRSYDLLPRSATS